MRSNKSDEDFMVLEACLWRHHGLVMRLRYFGKLKGWDSVIEIEHEPGSETDGGEAEVGAAITAR